MNEAQVAMVSAGQFASKVDELRAANVESQETAARRVGVSVRQYKRWLSPDDRPERVRQSSVRKVADAYGVDLAWFVNGESSAPVVERPVVHEHGLVLLDTRLSLIERRQLEILELLERRERWRWLRKFWT